MRSFFIIVILFVARSGYSQTSFPLDFVGHWKGELLWYKTGRAEPQKVRMQLIIQPGDSSGTYTWNLIYGERSEDNRPYLLLPQDSINCHWKIDEHNGIILDQYWNGNKFAGSFTVMGNTITNSYWIENDKLMVEFFSFSAKPLNTTGKGTTESPTVDSYRMGGYQKAVLTKDN